MIPDLTKHQLSLTIGVLSGHGICNIHLFSPASSRLPPLGSSAVVEQCAQGPLQVLARGLWKATAMVNGKQPKKTKASHGSFQPTSNGLQAKSDAW